MKRLKKTFSFFGRWSIIFLISLTIFFSSLWLLSNGGQSIEKLTLKTIKTFGILATEKTLNKSNSLIASAPVVKKGVMYYAGKDGSLYSLDIKNKAEYRIWKVKRRFLKANERNEELNNEEKFLRQPVIDGGVAYIQNFEGKLLAIDLKKKEKLWITKEGFSLGSEILFDKKQIYIIKSEGSELTALNKKSGKTAWITTNSDINRIAVDQKRIYAASQIVEVIDYDKEITKIKSVLFAIDPKTGKEIWRFKDKVDLFGELIIKGNNLYFFGDNGSSNAANRGNFYLIDVKTGRKKWKTKDYSLGEMTMAAVSKDSIYFISNDNVLHALDKNTHEIKWKQKLDVSITTGTVKTTCMILATNNLVIVFAEDYDRDYIFVFDSKGKEKSKYKKILSWDTTASITDQSSILINKLSLSSSGEGYFVMGESSIYKINKDGSTQSFINKRKKSK